ncbi:MAG: SIS domain-containing protein [Candidatus Odinarchaeia archaeon]
MEALSNFMVENYNAILTQPEAVEKTLNVIYDQINNGGYTLPKHINRVYLTGCGDSYCISRIAKFWFEEFTNIPTENLFPLDFHYLPSNLMKNSIVVGISASGQTIQTLNAIRKVNRIAYTIGVTNDKASNIINLVRLPLITCADKPVGFSPSKTTLTALLTLHLLALSVGKEKGTVSKPDLEKYFEELRKLPTTLKNTIKVFEGKIKVLAEEFSSYEMFYILGSGPHLGVASIGEAKIKEHNAAMVQAVELEEFAHYHILTVMDKTVVLLLKPTSTDIIRFNDIIKGLKELDVKFNIINQETLDNLRLDVYTSIILFQLFAHYLTRYKNRNPDGFRMPHAQVIPLTEKKE